jgi:hypothetical protein
MPVQFDKHGPYLLEELEAPREQELALQQQVMKASGHPMLVFEESGSYYMTFNRFLRTSVAPKDPEKALKMWAKLTQGAVNGVKVESNSTGKTEAGDWESELECMLEQLEEASSEASSEVSSHNMKFVCDQCETFGQTTQDEVACVKCDKRVCEECAGEDEEFVCDDCCAPNAKRSSEDCDDDNGSVHSTCCVDCGKGFTFDEPVSAKDYYDNNHEQKCSECNEGTNDEE